MSSRDKIIEAAVAMLKSDMNATLSVRTVAAEAGVSTGTLRHFFPTQRQLRDSVFTNLYENAFPDGNVHDQSIPARDRLMECLRHMLSTVESVEEARDIWSKLSTRLFMEDTSEAVRADYRARVRQTLGRIEYWLCVLTDEGSLKAGDNTQRARFLLTVLNGIMFERILPTQETALADETVVLSTAIDGIFHARA